MAVARARIGALHASPSKIMEIDLHARFDLVQPPATDRVKAVQPSSIFHLLERSSGGRPGAALPPHEVKALMARAAAEALEPLATGVQIVEASTVVCVREGPAGTTPRTLSHSDYALDGDGTTQLGEFEWAFSSGLQVLMGQSEVATRAVPTTRSPWLF